MRDYDLPDGFVTTRAICWNGRAVMFAENKERGVEAIFFRPVMDMEFVTRAPLAPIGDEWKSPTYILYNEICATIRNGSFDPDDYFPNLHKMSLDKESPTFGAF